MEDKKQIKIRICQTKNPPILGNTELVKDDIYVVKNKALIGNTYTIICPKCHHPLMAKATSAKPHKKVCNICNTVIYYRGKEMPLEENKQQGEVKKLPTTKYGKPDARLVWGSIFNKKIYDIIRSGEHYIGRCDSEVKSDVSINDEYVSRRSIVINATPKGNGCDYLLTVKNATNPILVNGVEKRIGESIYLNFGDTILVGNTTLTFKKRSK